MLSLTYCTVVNLCKSPSFVFQASVAERYPPTQYETSIQSAAIPQNFDDFLTCADSQYACMMQIHSAIYQERCDDRFEDCRDQCKSYRDNTMAVQQQCQNLSPDNRCHIQVSDTQYGDFCPGRMKQLLITYRCGCVRTDRIPVPEQTTPRPFVTQQGEPPSSSGGYSLCQHKLFKEYLGCDG